MASSLRGWLFGNPWMGWSHPGASQRMCVHGVDPRCWTAGHSEPWLEALRGIATEEGRWLVPLVGVAANAPPWLERAEKSFCSVFRGIGPR